MPKSTSKSVPGSAPIKGAKVFGASKIGNLNKPLNKFRKSSLNTKVQKTNPNL